MSATIIAVVNQKGGVGKTTISMHIAASLSQRKYKVLIVDADKQASATSWATAASDGNLFPATITQLSAAKSKLHREVKKYVDDFDWIVIDAPPSEESPLTRSALLIADLAVIPVLPSPLDLWASIGIRETISDQIMPVNENLRSRLVLNQCAPKRTLSKEAAKILAAFEIPLCKTIIRDREAYRKSPAFGQTVHYLAQKDKRIQSAVDDIEALVDELLGVLENSQAVIGE